MRVDISGETLEKFENIMKDNNFSTVKKTVEYVLEQYLILSDLAASMAERDENMVDMLLSKLDEKYGKIYSYNYSSLKKASNNIEKNCALLLDAANTILINLDYDTCHPVDFFKSPVVEKSEERYKERISNLKQKKDNRKV